MGQRDIGECGLVRGSELCPAPKNDHGTEKFAALWHGLNLCGASGVTQRLRMRPAPFPSRTRPEGSAVADIGGAGLVKLVIST
jgi:hypothetical protein